MKIIKEKNMKNFVRNISIILITLLAFILPSCKIGLGEAVDLQAPEITVTSPERSSYIPQTVTITGSAKDNIGVTGLFVEINETEQKYQYNGQEWQVYSNGNWISYANGQVSGTETQIDWSVTVTIQGAKTGQDYTITTQAYDAFKNEGAISIDERSVTIDITEPIVSIISPAVNSDYTSASADFASYTLQNNSILTSLYNETITLSGSQKEDTKLSKLYVYIDDKTANTFDSEDETYLIKKEISGNNLRNWESTLKKEELPEAYRTGKHLLRIVTESHDIAGNIECKVQGWFTYWNEADLPWIAADFGGDTLADKKQVFPGSKLQGQAYDDDGLKSVQINVYLSDGTEVKEKEQTINLEKEDYPKYYAWSLVSLGSSGVFYIKATCTDKNGVTGTQTIKYMEVTDVNPPSITITSPSNNSKLPIPGNGDLVFTGSVSDDDGVSSLKLVRLATGKEETAIKYFMSSFADWSLATATGATVSSGDTKGNKIYTLPLTDAGTENGLHKYTYSKTFNLFTDFGINGSTELLNTQSFILMAVDGSGSSSIEMISCTGDTQAPEISITDIRVCTDNNANTWSEWQSLADNPEISGISTATKVKFKGTWSDASERVNNIIFTWNGAQCGTDTDGSFEISANANHTWETGELIHSSTFTTAAINAEITDWGGNTGKTTSGFTLDNAEPQLILITSTNQDGSYKAGNAITIVMQFNKNITFTGTPSLILNVNGKTAVYDSGNGTSKHYYKYIVDDGVNIPKLNVTGINKDGCEWKDSGGRTVDLTNIPTSEDNTASLIGGRSICIDTTKPTVTKVECNTTAGTFKSGKEIFFTATFSEDVNITGIDNLKLKLNATPATVYATNATKKGTNAVTFKYAVEAGQNTPTEKDLQVTGFEITGCTITDIAGNEIETPTKTCTSGIYIDTVKPATPSISGVSNTTIYSDGGAKFIVSNFENGIKTKEYSIDGGKSWNTYTGEVTIPNNGTYKITARQKDAAGNQSDNATNVDVKIDKGNILQSIKATVADGTYTTNDVIPIILTFRLPVTIAGTKTLSLSNGKTATLDGSENGTKLTFKYTVAVGDSGENIDVSTINATFTDADGITVTDYVTGLDKISGNTLKDNSSINVVTSNPVVNGVSLNGTELKITFNESISKNSGNITLTFDETDTTKPYKAPAILSVEEYNKLAKKNSNLKTYYELGTNGSDENGNSDLTEKYILKYSYDTNDTNLLSAIKTAGANTITIPVNSSYVTISGSVITVKLTDSYELPVKGAQYKVEFAENIVKNNKNIQNNKYENDKGSVSYGGIEKPVIRINKTNESIDITNKTVKQPLTAGVKFDCQTPGIEPGNKGLNWTVNYQKNEMETYTNSAITKKKINCEETEDGLNSTNSTTSNKITIGKTDDTSSGYIYKITAVVNYGTNTETVYEYAYRSVYTLLSAPSGEVGNYKQLWLRGGDWTNGGNSTSSFPVSWNTKDFDKVRAMTNTENSDWTWVSWNINKPAYLQPLRGDLPSDAVENGPEKWSWGMQGPVPTGLEKYALYPGQSLAIEGGRNYQAEPMSFNKKHCEYRDNKGNVIKSEKPLEVPAGATTVFTGSFELTNGGECKELVLDSFDYKIGTELYITVDTTAGWVNWKTGNWGTDIGNYNPNMPVSVIVIDKEEFAKQLNKRSIWVQADKLLITKIQAYNP